MVFQKILKYLKLNSKARKFFFVTLSVLCIVEISFFLDMIHPVYVEIQDAPTHLFTYQEIFFYMNGSFVHTLLEWTAVCIAIITFVLAFVHYYINRNQISTLIIGLALLFAGIIDAYHVIISDFVTVDFLANADQIQFTWIISRFSNSILMFIGVVYFVSQHKKLILEKDKDNRHYWLIIICAIILVSIVIEVVHYVAHHDQLVFVNLYPDNFIKRPWDFVILIFFIINLVVVYPIFFNRYPGPFSFGILISAIPEILVQLHMSLGSVRSQDDHYMMAHILKLVAYLIPLIGLIMDYVYRTEKLNRQKRVLHIERKKNLHLEIELKGRHDALNNAAIISEFDIDGVYLKVNDTFLSYAGYREDEIVGKSYSVLLDKDFSLEAFLETLKSGKVWKGQFKKTSKDKRPYFTDNTITPVLKKNGQISKFISVEFDISSEVMQSVELSQKTVDLENSNKELKEFAFIASHDLQSPLRTISTYLTLLEKNNKATFNEESLEFLGYAKDAAKRMQNMVRGLLTLSSINTQQEFEEVDLNEVLQDFLDDNKFLLEEKNVILKINKLPVIDGVKNQLYHLFTNLITNSIKYVKDKIPIVQVGYIEDPFYWKFYVKDNGIGIDSKQQEEVFKLFSRLNGKEFEGSGIGLNICKKVVEHHNGKIWFESQKNESTTFYFTIEKS